MPSEHIITPHRTKGEKVRAWWSENVSPQVNAALIGAAIVLFISVCGFIVQYFRNRSEKSVIERMLAESQESIQQRDREIASLQRTNVDLKRDRDKYEIISRQILPDAPPNQRLDTLLDFATNGRISLDRVETKVDGILKILQKIEKDNRLEFVAEFPLGYTLFTVTGSHTVLPLDGPMPLRIDWSGLEMNIGGGKLKVTLPLIVSKNGPVSYKDVIIMNQAVGSQFQLDLDPNKMAGGVNEHNVISLSRLALTPEPTLSIVLRVLESRQFGDVLLLGEKPFNPN